MSKISEIEIPFTIKDDLLNLSKPSINAITKAIKKRFDSNNLHTYIGYYLVRLNSFQTFPLEITKKTRFYPRRFYPPDLFAFIDKIYLEMIEKKQNQLIVLNGESGSGKTQTTKEIMEFLLLNSLIENENQNIKKIQSCFKLLEVFGNAATKQNPNSTRFESFFEIHFNKKGNICGMKVNKIFIESSRIYTRKKGERNFHIFYQLLRGLKIEEKEQLGVSSIDEFNFLTQSGRFSIEGVNDSHELVKTQQAFNDLGITQKTQSKIFQILIAILFIGNIQFEEENENAIISNQTTISWISSLIKVDPNSLINSLTFKTISSEISTDTISAYSIPQTLNEAQKTRDALASEMYSRVFEYIIEIINKNLNSNQDHEFEIKILDYSGFQKIDKQDLNGLFTNYLNEKLQQLSTINILKKDQSQYQKEKIKWQNIPFNDNQIICNFIEDQDPNGIIYSINKSCEDPNKYELDQLISQIQKLQRNLRKNQIFTKNNQNL
ncbi:dilute class unconventional myosin isoform c [Anaeramoeba ignava]|uniref:Dilute class unconventional myosin isoform c n=1 Tax=Anaeramoeba ignava TaxID=1746090 RepID=A0A9Q0LGY7_ANAIG|nr:dilute class unconventional myosin isoform c [Anaeramoeba ignava]